MTLNIPDRLTALSNEALAFIASEKAEAMALQWLGSDPSLRPLRPHNGQSPERWRWS
jgi:hypothetical protein